MTQWAETKNDVFEMIVDRAADGLMVVDHQGVVRFANPAAKALFQGRIRDLIGFNFGLPAVSEPVEITIGSHDQPRHVELRSSEVAWRGRPACLAVLRDITQRKTAEDSLKQSKAQYQLLADNTLDVIWSMNLELVFTYVNPAIFDLTGHQVEEWLGTSLSHHCEERAFQRMAEIVGREIEKGPDRQGVIFETEMLRKDGTFVEVEIHGKVVFDQDDHPVGLQGTTRDIGYRKKKERQQKLALEVLDALNGGTDTEEILGLIQTAFGVEAIGIRVREGRDYPYYAALGFPEEFIQTECVLCLRDSAGEIALDQEGNPFLECMCGVVLQGRTQADWSCFTSYGSFWTNAAAALFETEAVRQLATRNRCGVEGYASLALIPLWAGDEVIGLLQLCDREEGKFDLDTVEFLQEMGASIGIALARKQVERELQKSEELLKKTGEMARIGGWEVDLESNAVHWTSAIRKIHEVPEEYVPNLEQAIAFYPPGAQNTLREAVERTRETGTPFDLELPFNTATGRRLWIKATGMAEFEDGKCVRLHGTFQDVTERREAERRLLESETKYFDLFESSPVAKLVVSAQDHTVLESNQAAEELTGRSKSELIGMNAKDLYADTPDGQAKARSFFDGFSGKENALIEKLDLITKQRRMRHVNLYVSPHANEMGAVLDYRLAFIDITEQLTLEAQLLQSQKMEAVGRLAGGVAHDFNNILTNIIGVSQLLLMDAEEGTDLYEDIQEIKAAADRAADLTRQLLAFSRKQVFELKRVDANEEIRNMEKMLGRLLGEDVDIDTQYTDDPCWIKVDPAQLEQIIMNLAVNARDAMPGGGRLIIEINRLHLDENYAQTHTGVRPGPYVRIAVTDTGLGMDETTQSQIFEPFFTTKELGKGTGLGLATVFGIVQQSGGHIWVYSELNEGTTFKVYLPEDAEPERQTEEPPEIPHQRSDHGKTVLVVEDEEPVRRLAVRALSRRGYNVLDAADARTALGIVRESDQVVDLIITDVVMPGMSGVEFGKEVDAVLDDPPPIIYMSGYTEHSLLQQVRLNKKNYLQKPFNPDELVRMVSRTIDGQ